MVFKKLSPSAPWEYNIDNDEFWWFCQVSNEIECVLNCVGTLDHWFLLFTNSLKLLSIPESAGFKYNGLK